MRMKGVTTGVSRLLVNHIKFYAESVIPEFRIQYGDVLVIVNVVDRSLEESDTAVVQANYNALSQSVRVEVVAPVDITGSWFSKFIPEFKRSLRHELEHFSQHKRAGLTGDVLMPFLILDGSLKGKPEKGPWRTVGMAARYLLNPVEIEAHVVGIKMEANARRTKFQVVFKEILEMIRENLHEAGFTGAGVSFLIRRLFQVWGFYALARYPSLRRRTIKKKVRVFTQKEFDFPQDE